MGESQLYGKILLKTGKKAAAAFFSFSHKIHQKSKT